MKPPLYALAPVRNLSAARERYINENKKVLDFNNIVFDFINLIVYNNIGAFGTDIIVIKEGQREWSLRILMKE